MKYFSFSKITKIFDTVLKPDLIDRQKNGICLTDEKIINNETEKKSKFKFDNGLRYPQIL